MIRVAQLMFACVLLTVAAGRTQAAPILSFIIDGDTFNSPFTITNESTAGELVTRFQLDLAGTGFGFDTVEGGPPNGTFGAVPFTPFGGTDVTTGFVGPIVVADGATVLDISFTDFQATESFRWLIDIDPFAANANLTVTGNALAGATAFVDFSNGQRLLGQLQLVPGNPDASAFTVTGVTATPAIPEPGSVAIFGIGASIIAIRASRRRRHKLARS